MATGVKHAAAAVDVTAVPYHDKVRRRARALMASKTTELTRSVGVRNIYIYIYEERFFSNSCETVTKFVFLQFY